MTSEFEDSTQPAALNGLTVRDQTRAGIVTELLASVSTLNVHRIESKAVVDAHGEERVFRELQLRAVQQIAHQILQRAEITRNKTAWEAASIQIEVCLLKPPELRQLLELAYEEGRNQPKEK